MAIKLEGAWKEGYALDFHTENSEFLGNDQYGNSRFDTTRTEVGELLYQLKYQSNINVMHDIINKAISFIILDWLIASKLELVIPIPPSNINREVQPVLEIAEGIANQLNIFYDYNALIKKDNTQIKNLDINKRKEKLSKSFQSNVRYKNKYNILLVDDVCDSGETIKTATSVLAKEDKIKDIYVLTITKTKKGAKK